MKYWMKAIWEHLKSFLVDVVIVLTCIAVTIVCGTAAIGAVCGIMFLAMLWVGGDGVLILLVILFGLSLLAAIIRWLVYVFKSIKATKERLEEMDNGND